MSTLVNQRVDEMNRTILLALVEITLRVRKLENKHNTTFTTECSEIYDICQKLYNITHKRYNLFKLDQLYIFAHNHISMIMSTAEKNATDGNLDALLELYDNVTKVLWSK